MFCKKCGNNIPDGTTFCTSCGADISGSAATPQQQPGQQSQQHGQPSQQYQQPRQAQQYQQPQPRPQQSQQYYQQPAQYNQQPQQYNQQYQQPQQPQYYQQPQPQYYQQPYAAQGTGQYGQVATRKKSKAPIVIPIVLILVVALGVGIFFIARSFGGGAASGPSGTYVYKAEFLGIQVAGFGLTFSGNNVTTYGDFMGANLGIDFDAGTWRLDGDKLIIKTIGGVEISATYNRFRDTVSFYGFELKKQR